VVDPGPVRAVADVDLDVAAIPDAAVEEARALEDRREEGELRLDVAVAHLEPGVPVAEIAVEADVGMAFDQLHRAPDVLGGGGAVGLDVERHAVLRRGRDDRLDHAVDLGVGLHAPADVQRRAFGAHGRDLRGVRVGFLGPVDAAARGEAQAELARDGEVAALHAGVAGGLDALVDRASAAARRRRRGRQVAEDAHVEVDAQPRRRRRPVVAVGDHGARAFARARHLNDYLAAEALPARRFLASAKASCAMRVSTAACSQRSHSSRIWPVASLKTRA
jgi:hypothetical protein